MTQNRQHLFARPGYRARLQHILNGDILPVEEHFSATIGGNRMYRENIPPTIFQELIATPPVLHCWSHETRSVVAPEEALHQLYPSIEALCVQLPIVLAQMQETGDPWNKVPFLRGEKIEYIKIIKGVDGENAFWMPSQNADLSDEETTAVNTALGL